MRLFIGIELPKAMKKELLRVQREVKSRSASGRFGAEDNFHLTLHFVGECDDIYSLATAMKEAVRGIRPFALHLSGCGQFERSGSVIPYVSLGGNLGELGILYESLESALCDNGFSREHKGFTPHITFARNVKLSEQTPVAGDFAVNSSMSVASIALFESASINGQLKYSVLHREKF